LRLLAADAGLEAPVRCNPTEGAALPVLQAVRAGPHLRTHHDGDEDLRWISHFHAVKTGLRDPNHGHRVTIEGDGSADDGAVAVEVGFRWSFPADCTRVTYSIREVVFKAGKDVFCTGDKEVPGLC
jgi:hypothetical protein